MHNVLTKQVTQAIYRVYLQPAWFCWCAVVHLNLRLGVASIMTTFGKSLSFSFNLFLLSWGWIMCMINKARICPSIFWITFGNDLMVFIIFALWVSSACTLGFVFGKFSGWNLEWTMMGSGSFSWAPEPWSGAKIHSTCWLPHSW